MRSIMLSTVAIFLTALPAFTADEPAKNPEEKAKEYLNKFNALERARLTVIKDSVAKAFPKHSFVGVVYPQFPIGREAPAPLKEANVLAIAGDKVVPLTDIKELQKFFVENASKEGVEVTKAWLRLSAELSQDGFYKFGMPSLGSGTAGSDGTNTFEENSGKIAVDPVGGNKGEITATVRIKNGVVEKIDHKVNLMPGPRPRCQATKLLDADPIVRQMAEDSIRVMGSACKYYLDEQRAKATPELQKAIDRMWQRIVDEGR